ncbi:MAG: hypothetical protein ABL953_03900 [Ilumatobacteraceae bacterium]
MNRFLTRALATSACLIAVAACGDDSKTANTTPDTTAPATEALRYVTIGGCQMMGPNCATYVVYSDGTVEIYRTDENAPAEVVGSIPAAEVAAFLDSVKDTDFEGLVAEVGPGTCNACVDGLDIKATITFSDGPVELDSTIVNFDLAHPLFANLETLMEDVRAVGELEIQQRI